MPELIFHNKTWKLSLYTDQNTTMLLLMLYLDYYHLKIWRLTVDYTVFLFYFFKNIA